MSSRNEIQTDNLKKRQNTEHALHQCKGPNDEPPHKQASRSAGYSGLVNHGATCYLNATLQTLFMTEEFRKAVMLKGETEENENIFSHQLGKLFISLTSKGKTGFTHEVIKALGIKCAHEQQDAAEYYQKIMNKLDPDIVKMFQGTEIQSTVCPKNHEYTEEKSFFSLAISMDSSLVSSQCNSIDVQKSFDARFEKVSMTDDNRLYCEICKKQTYMDVECTISELPDILTLQLKRFEFDYSYRTYMKNERRAEIPFRLTVKDESGVVYQYDLYALVNHVGSLSGGHYYAHIKSFEDQQWYEFNDSSVHRIRFDERQLPTHLISETACLLFFKKQQGQEQSTTVTTASLVATGEYKHHQYEHTDAFSEPQQNTAGPEADIKAESLKEISEGQTCATNINTDSKIDKHSSAKIRGSEIIETTLSVRTQQQRKQGQHPKLHQKGWHPLSEIVEKSTFLDKSHYSIPGSAEAPDTAMCKLKEEQSVDDAGDAPFDSSSAVQDVSSSPLQEITSRAAPADDILCLKIQKLKAKIELLDIKKEYYAQKLKKLTNS